MSEEQIDETDGARLRAELQELVTGNKSMSERVTAKRLEFAFKDAGFDTSTGVGKAVADLYEGEPDPDAIREFASAQFGVTPSPSEADLRAQAAQQRAEGEARMAMINQAAMPIRAPSIDDDIQKAMQSGDLSTAGRLNAQKLERARHGSPEYRR